MAGNLLKTSSLTVRTNLLHQMGISLYNTSHGFYEEELEKKLQQFPGGSVDLQKEDSGIGILTLNNPSKMNAFSGVMMLQLLERVIELENWTEGKGLIVRGAGNTFSSGSDLNAVRALVTPEREITVDRGRQREREAGSLLSREPDAGLDPRTRDHDLSQRQQPNPLSHPGAQHQRVLSENLILKKDGLALCMFMQNTLTRLMRLPLISVALIQGWALGGGAEVTTACDFRLMTAESEIRFVHKDMGIIPSWGSGTRLVKIIGSRQALKVLSGALKLDSKKALDIGMAEKVLQSTDETECLGEAREWLMQFTRGPPEVIRALKRCVSSGKELCFEEALEIEKDLVGTVWGGPVHKEAIARKGKLNK